jgi:hypothetical protein
LVVYRAPATPERRLRLLRGITTFPSVGDGVLLPSSDQLRAIVEASGTDTRVPIGTAPFANDASVTIDPDKLFGRHVAVFGNTGSGKSCSVAGIVRWSIEAAALTAKHHRDRANARFVILDPNGEYLSCFDDLRRHIDVEVYSVDPSAGTAVKQLCLPAWMWNSQEWAALLAAAPATQRPILLQALRVLRGAALVAGADQSATDGTDLATPEKSQELLLAAQIKAHCDYLQSFRAAGVQAYGSGAKMFELHNSLERLAEDALLWAAEVTGDLATCLDTVGQTARTVFTRRQRISGGRTYKDGFGDGDLAEILRALDAAAALLPAQELAIRMTEDTPTRFDIHSLPGMIGLLTTLRGGLQQHLAGSIYGSRRFLRTSV